MILLTRNTRNKFTKIEAIPLFFIDAQRDIQIDLKDRSSYLGKLTERLEIKDAQIKEIEGRLNKINSDIVNDTPIGDIIDTVDDVIDDIFGF